MTDDSQEDATNEILIGLAEQRALHNDDNSLWTPLECAAAFLRDIRSGVIKPTCLLILYEEPLEGETGARLAGYAANLRRDEEVAMLELRKHQQLHRWMKS